MYGAKTAWRRVVQRRIGGAEAAAPKWRFPPEFIVQNSGAISIVPAWKKSHSLSEGMGIMADQ